MRIRPRSPETKAKARILSRRRRMTLWPVIALCLVIGAVAALWYATEGWPVIHRWSQRLLPRLSTPRNELPILALTIEAEADRALEGQHASATERGIWTPEETDWQPLQIELEQQTLSGRVRLDRNGADDWQTAKWPLQVQVEEGAHVLGMRSFSLRSPATCGYLSGWLYAQALRRAGILAPQHTFVNVSVNGHDWGVYAAVERVSAQSLAAQSGEQGTVVRLSGSTPGAGSDLPPLVAIESPDGTTDEPRAKAEATVAWDLVRGLQGGRVTPAQVFDPAQMGRYLAQVDLWGAGDGLNWDEERYYYAAETGKLAPIASYTSLLGPEQALANGLATYDDPPIGEAYVQEALRISEPAYLDDLRQEYAPQFERYYAALAQEFYPAYLEPPWQALGERQARLWATLHPAQTVQAYRVGAQTDGAIELQIANLLPYPVTLVGVRVGQQELELKAAWVADADWAMLDEASRPAVILNGLHDTVPHYVTLQIPLAKLAAHGPDDSTALDDMQVTTRLVGMPNETTVDVQADPRPAWPQSAIPDQPTVQAVLQQHPFLSRGGQPDYLEVASGTWDVAGDLILPEGFGLWATQPVTLTFERQAILFASGPLMLQGTGRDRIRLLPHDDAWGGLVVYRTGEAAASSLEYVEVQGTSGLSRNGWRLPGGVTFYGSPLVLRHCRVLDSTAPSALYVGDAAFAFTDTEFGQGSFDGFRADLAHGQMERCAFHDLLGDGISLFRSSLVVRDTALLRVYGQGMSVAGGSEVKARGIWSADTGVALASKDSSSVEVQDAHIGQAWGAGLAAYLESQQYGPANIRASQIVFEDDSTRAWLQDGNQITVEGLPVAAGEPEPSAIARRLELESTARIEHYRFGPALRLVGYDLPGADAIPGEPLPLTLYWQASAKLGRDYTVFVHILDSAGHIAAQWDAMPRGNTFVTTAWPVGEIVDDPHPVPLPADMPAGKYRIVLGVYDRPTADRLPAYGPDGELVANAAVLLKRVVEVQ